MMWLELAYGNYG